MTGTQSTKTAIEALAEAGVTKSALAAELPVCLRTVQRWAAGRHQPSRRNAATLRTLVEHLLTEATAAAIIADHRQVAALQRAYDALLTDAERAAEAALVARINATLDAAQAMPAPRSITVHADPFALCADSLDDRIDAAFARAA